MNYLEGLNEIQRNAVSCSPKSPMMIIAGPGSGKTRVLTHRIAYLIDQGGIDAFKILALTFTNKAAKEMRERIFKMVGSEAKNIWMGTFHSVFSRILRIEAHKIGYDSNFTIYDTTDSRSLIKTIIKEMQLDEKMYKPSSIQYRISSLKNDLITPAQYAKNTMLITEDEINGKKRFAELYHNYCKRCKLSGAMDFDDLLLNTHILLEQHPDVLHKYQHNFDYILVDEYQDTNFVQYSIIKKLAAVHERICVVGDDAQSIYSFRGANINNILNFQQDFSEVQIFKLEQNYRSTQKIVKAANEIIENNKKGLKKKIWTDNESGESVHIFRSPSDNEEGRLVADGIFDLKHRNHFKNNDFVILYRTNAQSRAFEESLRRINIPYKVYGGTAFYQRKEIKDLLAYLKLVVNPYDEEALRRVINFPARGIGQTTIEKISISANAYDIRIWDIVKEIYENPGNVNFRLPPKTLNAITGFYSMIKDVQQQLEKKSAYDLAFDIAKRSGLLKLLNDDKSVEGISRFDNVQELLNGIKEFSEQDEVLEGEVAKTDKSLVTYLQDITLLTDMDTADTESDHVKLMTLHAAKGLEFPCVFIVGMEESLFPSMMAMNSRDDLEEERRLFYVGVTRAEKHLFLSYATSRYRFGRLEFQEPSRFLSELPDEIVFNHVKQKSVSTKPKPATPQNGQFRNPPVRTFAKKNVSPEAASDFKADDPSKLQVGMDVEHLRFGNGKIQSIDGQDQNKIATIFFKEHGQKKIMLKYAKLRIFNRDYL